MPRTTNYAASEGDLIRGLIFDSRELFSREKYEERIDYQLAVLIQRYKKEKAVDQSLVRSVVTSFISTVSGILGQLEDAKRKAVQEEFRKINSIKTILSEVAYLPARNLAKELEKFQKSLKSNVWGILRSYRRKEKRLGRGKAPFGYVLKKLRNSKYLDYEVAKKRFKINEKTIQEHYLINEIGALVNQLNSKPGNKAVDEISKKINQFIDSYIDDLSKDFNDFLDIEIDIEIEEARKLHRIDL